MRFRPTALLASLLLVTAAAPTIAQTSVPSAPPGTSVPLDAAARMAIVAQLSAELRGRYIFPDVAEQAAAAITAAAAAGSYDRIVDLPAFTARLTEDLHAVLQDGHLEIFVANGTGRPPISVASIPAGDAGIVRADRLKGGIAYLQIGGFANPRAFKPALDRAMVALKGSRALILDVRGNGGGRSGVGELPG